MKASTAKHPDSAFQDINLWHFRLIKDAKRSTSGNPNFSVMREKESLFSSRSVSLGSDRDGKSALLFFDAIWEG